MTLCPEVALPQRCMPSVSGASGGTPAGTRGKAEGRHLFIPGSDAPKESPGLGLTGQEPNSDSVHSRLGPTKASTLPGDPWEAWGPN